MNWFSTPSRSPALRKAADAFRGGQFDRCLHYAETVLHDTPSESEALYLAGAAATYLQQSEKALDYLNRLNQLPESSQYGQRYYYRGMAQLELGQFERAIPDFGLSIEEHTLLAECYLNRGFCYLQTGRFQEASVDLTMAERYYPRSPDLLELLSFTYQQLNQPRKTLRYLLRLKDLEGLEADQYLRLAWALEERQRWEEAREAYDWALELDPQQIVAYNNRGHLFMKQKAYEAAQADFEEGLKRAPDFFALYLNRSTLHLETGALDAAWSDIERSLELEPADLYAHRNRAYYFLLKGEEERALRELDRVYAQDPRLPLLHYLRGRVYLQLGLQEQARTAFQRSADLGEAEGLSALEELGE